MARTKITYVRTGAPRSYYAHDLRGVFAIVTRPHETGGWTAASTDTPRRVVIGAATRAEAAEAVR